jgi:hypothetical protein
VYTCRSIIQIKEVRVVATMNAGFEKEGSIGIQKKKKAS